MGTLRRRPVQVGRLITSCLSLQAVLATSIPSRSVDSSLQSLLSFVAVTRSQDGDDVLGQLLVQCLIMSLGKPLGSPEDFSSTLLVLFGLDIAPQRLQKALDKLVEQGHISKPTGSSSFTANASLRQRIELRIESAKKLE